MRIVGLVFVGVYVSKLFARNAARNAREDDCVYIVDLSLCILYTVHCRPKLMMRHLSNGLVLPSASNRRNLGIHVTVE